MLKNVSKAQEAAPEARQAELEANYRRQYGHRWFEFMPKSLGGGYDPSGPPRQPCAPQTPRQPAQSDALLIREARQRAQVELAERIAAPAEDAAQIEYLDEAELKRVCKANGVLCSSKRTSCEARECELIGRLVDVREYGRPNPCPRCSAIVHVVDDDHGQLLECRRHLKRRGTWEPCGWSKRVTEANRSALLPWPLVDSDEGDLKRARELNDDIEAWRRSERAAGRSGRVLSGDRWTQSAPVVVASEQMM